MRPLLRATLCVLCASAVNQALAQDTWSLTTADFRRQTVSLKSLDDHGARIVPFGTTQETTIPLDKLLQLDRGSSAVQQVRGSWTILLVSGDRIGGDPASIANDSLIIKSPSAGQLTIPLKDVRDLYKGQEVPPKPTGPAAEPDRTDDVILLANGDNVRGIVTALDATKLTIKTSGGDELPVDLSAIKSVHLASAGKAPAAGRRAFRVQLSDGSVVTAPKIKIDNNQLQLIPEAGPPRPLDLASVTLIEQLNGPVAWLSAVPPDQVVYQPMFDVAFPPQTDRNYKGERIKFAGREFNRGIGVHAYCRLTWNIAGRGGQGGYKAFRTQYALSDDAHKGRVTVRILLDDKVVHQARDVGPGKLSPVILLDLAGAKTITLEAHPGGDPASQDPTKWNIDTQARLNWIEPALLKEKPAPEPAPATPTTSTTTKPTTTTPTRPAQ
jgi:NPCBM/NEW2 domain